MKLQAKLLALALTALLAGCMSDDKEVERVAPLASFQPTMKVAVAWTAPKAGRGTKGQYLRLQHEVANGNVYTASYQGTVIAADANTGQNKWQADIKEHITSGVAAQGNLAVVGTSNGIVVALNAHNGAQLWRAQASSEIIATPAIAGDKVLIKTESGDIQAFDRNTGNSRWSYHLSPPDLMLRGASAPVVVGNRVLAGFSDGQLISLSLADGRLQWTRQIAVPHGASAVERLVDIGSEPVVRDGTVYVVTYQGKLAAINLESGNLMWQHDISSRAGLAVDASAVYVADDSSHVWALDRQSGRVLWHSDKLEGRGLTQPVIQSGALAVGDSKGYIHWLSLRDGQFLARHSVDSKRLLATPQLYRGNLIVLSTGGRLVSLHSNR
jgi:outer membrane protein assembly factor BamB